jgi:hypothetical protein
MIWTEGTVVGVGATVLVGTGEGVTVGINGAGVVVPVGAGVSVGKAVGTKGVVVGSGVSVSKLNRAVGVTWVPWVGKATGLGNGLEAARERSRRVRLEQRQQNTSRTAAGRSTLPSWPCWR